MNLPLVFVMCVHSSAVPLIPLGSVCASPPHTTAPESFRSVEPKSDFATTGPGIGIPDDDDADEDDEDAEEDDEDAEEDDEAAEEDDDDDADEDPDDADEDPDDADELDQEVSGSVLGSVVVSSKQPATIVVAATMGTTGLRIRGIMRSLLRGGSVVGSYIDSTRTSQH